jgi:cation:H+ antiporter
VSNTEIAECPTVSHKKNILLPGICVVFVSLSYILVMYTAMSGTLAVIVQSIMFISTIYLVSKGADWFVDSASQLATLLSISPLVIGLTVVAFGTSAPEAITSLVAGLKGVGDITLANVVGSNIFNMCVILGCVAIIAKGGLPVERNLIRRDGPLLISSSIALFCFLGALPMGAGAGEPGWGPSWLRLFDSRLQFIEGVLLFFSLLCYLFGLYWLGRNQATVLEFSGHTEESVCSAPGVPVKKSSVFAYLLLLAFSVVLMLGSCQLMVGLVEQSINGELRGYGALWFARLLNVPDYTVGLTIIAAGTSAPEFVVSLVAALKGRFEICVGNLVGSSLFNIMGVMGLSGMVLQEPLARQVSISPSAVYGLYILIAISLITAFIMYTERRISLREGVLLFVLGLGSWGLLFCLVKH